VAFCLKILTEYIKNDTVGNRNPTVPNNLPSEATVNTIILKREDSKHLSSEIEGDHHTIIHRIKKKSAAIGLLGWHNKKSFNIVESFGGAGLHVIEIKAKYGTIVLVGGRPDILQEYAEYTESPEITFAIGLGQLMQKYRNDFNIGNIKYIDK
jgi:hypothetical protein